MQEFIYVFILTCAAHLVISDIPNFIKTPEDKQVTPGSTVELECSAIGPPNLVISWQLNGVNNFPAIQEKRWHVEPAQSVTFIINVRKIDEGVYSCIATNKDGSNTANATVTVIDHKKPGCIDWKDELVPSGQDYILSGDQQCQVCTCDNGLPSNCRNGTCDTPSCSNCFKSKTSKSGIQNDAIMNNPNGENVPVKVEKFDHTTNHVEGNEGETILNKNSLRVSKPDIEKGESTSNQGSVSKDQQISNQTSVTVKPDDGKGDKTSDEGSKGQKISNNGSVAVKPDIKKGEGISNQTSSTVKPADVMVTKEVDVSNQDSVAKEQIISNDTLVDLIGESHHLISNQSLIEEKGDNSTVLLENKTEGFTGTTEQVTELPNITCTDWKGNIHLYGEEYAPYKEDSCNLCSCGKEEGTKQCRTVRIIQCPDRNCTYYVWKIGMDCCEYECIKENVFQKPKRKPRKRKLEIIKPPKNATILAEYSHTLHCRANKRKQNVVYKWFKDGVRIKDRFNRDEDTGNLKYDINKKTGSLKLIHVRVEDKGVYQCKVKHGNETLISEKVYIQVQVPVKFVGLIPYNRTVMCGNPVQLVCNVYGLPVPRMIWTKNGRELGDKPPDGINIYTTYQDNHVLSRLYIKNVTETNRYGCKAYNRPVDGMNMVKQDVQITMMCSVGTKNKPVGQCVSYNGSFCSSEIESRNVHKIVNVSYEELDKKVQGMMDDMKRAMTHIDERCLTSAKKIFCNHVFPSCHEEDGEAKEIKMCRQSCQAVNELLCFEPWLMVAHSSSGYKLPVCESLPSKLDPTVKCVDIPMFVRNPQETRNSCYKGTGQWYNGTVNVTKSGKHCQSWESQHPHTHQRPPDVFPSLEGAENYCRNPGSEEKSPWCYTTDYLVRWEVCDIPNCDGEPVLPNPYPSEEGKHQFSTEAIIIVSIVAAVGAFVIGLICILCYQIFRQRRNIKYNSAPQDEMDIDIDKLQPNISYHKMADIKLNPRLQTLEYPRNDVVYLCDIGQGAFGRVFKAKVKDISEDEEDCFVAVKMLKDDASEDLQQDFEREASLMAEFDHPNIVKLLGICAIGKPMCLLFEFMENGDLNGFLRLCSSESNYIIRRNSVDKKSAEQFHHVGTNQQLHILLQVCSGMVYLSERGYVHRDLATRNCLVGENLTVKISDFGLARSVHSMEYYKGSDHDAIPIRWMPLESILYNKFTSESDVWSFGVLLWEVFSYALQPYYGMSHEEVVQFIKEGKVLACPDKTPKAIYDLMRLCWSRKPANRPRFITISKSINSIYEELQKKNSLNEIV